MSINTITEAAIHTAYNNLHNFFKDTDLPNELNKLEKLIKAASSKRPCKNKPLQRLVPFVHSLLELCNAAFTIYRANHKLASAWWPLPEGDIDVDITQVQQYVNTSFNSSPWECLPRHLSWVQYHDPYKAIKKFTQAMSPEQWEKALRLLLAHAIRPGGLQGVMTITKVMRIRKRLAQLIEACHLIVVRKCKMAGK